MHSEFEKSQALKILSMYTNVDELTKAEGSRGGKIIGHTGSGKPIYDSANHPSHKNFTSEDHRDASAIHNYKSDWGRDKEYNKNLATEHKRLSTLKPEDRENKKYEANYYDRHGNIFSTDIRAKSPEEAIKNGKKAKLTASHTFQNITGHEDKYHKW